MPSLWEDPGFVLIEASYSNTTIISSDCENGPKEILNVRDLINQISKDTGAISVISRAEIDKIPAKIRILYEF